MEAREQGMEVAVEGEDRKAEHRSRRLRRSSGPRARRC
jgi:hypothetical protein